MSLVERVTAIILRPAAEWRVIAGEPGSIGELFGSYVAILAAIPAVCGLIGALVAGQAILGTRIGVGALTRAIIEYLGAFVVMYVIAWIVNALAETFGSTKNFTNALKLVVYSHTPVWLCGIFQLIPGVRFLAVLGLYGLYLLWLGLPPLMNTPANKTISYVVAIVACEIVAVIVIGVALATVVIGIRALT